MRHHLVVSLVLASIAVPVGAEVRVVTLPDGSITVTNEGGGSARSRALVRRPPPAHLDPVIQRHADATSLDPKLIEAVIQVESGYNSRAVSRKGAQGLMQLMPQTARELGVANPFDPEENVSGGSRYLRAMLDSFGSLDLALAAYNAGPTAVQRHGGIPPYAETRDYVRKVLGLLRGGVGGGGLEVLSFVPASGTPRAVSVPASLLAEAPRVAPAPRPVIVRREVGTASLVAASR